MNDRTGAPHLLRVRTPGGEVWEAAAPYVYSLSLALKMAALLRGYLSAPCRAPGWAHVLRVCLEEDGVRPDRCVVEVAKRGEGGRWRVVAEFDAVEEGVAAA